MHGDEVRGDKILNYHPQQTTFPKALSAKAPRLAADKIVGRAAELADLHQRLYDRRQVLLVNGMGGIGKTTLAQVYVAQFWDEYQHVVWVRQSSDDIVNDFVFNALHSWRRRQKASRPRCGRC